MKARKYNKEGVFVSEVELPAELFATGISLGAIYDAVKAENANNRQGTHSTKDRSEVRGGGIKPWAQKGTGRARQGSIRAPHFVGGGIIHGPKPRDYSSNLSRSVKKKAVLSILNKKAEENRIAIIEDVEPSSYSTKSIYNILKNMDIAEKGNVGLVVAGENQFLKRSTRNIENLKYVNSKRVVCRDILYNNNLVISESALKELQAQYSKKG
ncbi:50S ribosomal protein L4 [Leptospira harrisiae]|uniref:Large ribosomal subunit protein uL4 n=1 Tax=Leptospira harrisiae TaxID=2023189 RepID=A0A2N0APK0_9LEPT|nr:50S ribosomal protein L4 [Leptospira harrisiae]PJZ86236.1 50S ribosomal protein L4 [Leptospira harrisiae]PKA09802.1 50S ribosomal protein L4 [Leptospira harrisiae]